MRAHMPILPSGLARLVRPVGFGGLGALGLVGEGALACCCVKSLWGDLSG